MISFSVFINFTLQFSGDVFLRFPLPTRRQLIPPQQDPIIEQERVYRWLKRQFIQLTATPSEASQTVGSKGQHGAAFSATGACRDPGSGGGGVISWESARQLLRRGPPCLESSLMIDLSRLSKDLWAADLADVGRTSVALESLRWRRRSAQNKRHDE